MWKALRRWWKYLATMIRVRQEELADPKVQLEQAIEEAREHHQRLTEQAASVIANQKQAQVRLDRVLAEYEKANASARQALLLADQEARSGSKTTAARFNETAEAFATKLLGLERDIGEHERALLQATSAAENAKAAVAQNAAKLQQRLSEREHLLSKLDQAKMQEQLNKARAQLSSAIGEDVPTFEEVHRKIERRLAHAEGVAELTGNTIEVRMFEVERAQMRAEAQARLSQLRSELGLGIRSTDRPESATEAKGQ